MHIDLKAKTAENACIRPFEAKVGGKVVGRSNSSYPFAVESMPGLRVRPPGVRVLLTGLRSLEATSSKTPKKAAKKLQVDSPAPLFKISSKPPITIEWGARLEK